MSCRKMAKLEKKANKKPHKMTLEQVRLLFNWKQLSTSSAEFREFITDFWEKVGLARTK